MSVWDTGISPEDHKLLEKAKELLAIEGQIKQLKERASNIKEDITDIVPQEIGDVERMVGVRKVVISRPSRNDWNHEMLLQIFGEHDPLPDYVTKKLQINKRDFEALPEETQRTLFPALTRKPGPMQVRVEEPHATT